MHKKELIIKAAHAGGKVLLKYFGTDLKVKTKSILADLQTDADVGSEKAILKILEKEFPKHNIWGEESGLQDKKSKYTFVIDPLDGSLNYIYNIPYFSVAIALLKDKEPILSVIYDPVLGRTYYAEKNKGAFLNNKKIRVNKESNIKNTSVVYIARYINSKQYYLNLLEKLHNYEVKRVLVNWSVALDFCLFSMGKIEAIIHNGSEPYDYAAGKLLAQEAGALITNFKGDKKFKEEEFLVTNGTKIHKQLLKII